MKQDVYIVAAKRTPFGKYRGRLSPYSAVDLGVIALKGLLKEVGLPVNLLDSIFVGNVLAAGLGQNMARQIGLESGMRLTSTATTINEVCGSSLKAIRLAQAQMLLGDNSLVVVGGSESMSQAPMLFDRRKKLEQIKAQDSLKVDGLIDAFSKQPMGITAENVASGWHVSRKAQDDFSFESHRKASQAIQKGWFESEILPIKTMDKVLDRDEAIRPNISHQDLAHLKPVFKPNGTITAGNASPISDGAAMVLLATSAKAEALGLKPVAKLGAYAEIGMDPSLMGFGPHEAILKLLSQTKTTLTDYDVIEINEAFAAPMVAVSQALNLDLSKLNPAGGAIAIGHPLGETGARLIGACINGLERMNGELGLVSLCIGGGLAIALQIRRQR